MAKLAALVPADQFEKTVAEPLRENYVKSEDGLSYVLDVDDAPYKAKVGEFRSTNVALEKRIKDLTASMEKFKDIDPERAHKAFEALQAIEAGEDAELIKKGKIDDVLSRRTQALRANYENQIKGLTDSVGQAKQETTTLRNKLGTVMINTAALTAAQKAGQLRQSAADDVINRAHSTWKIDENGEMRPIDANGGVMRGKNGTDILSFDEWAASLVKTAPHFFEPPKGGGGRGGSDRTEQPGGGKLVDREDPLAMGRNAALIASGKVNTTPNPSSLSR